MKTLFKVLVLAVFLTAIGIITSAAQDQECSDLAACFEKFKTQARAKCGERDAALVTGKAIIDKFGSDELNKEVIDFVKKKMAAIQQEDPVCKRNNRYDAAYKAKNWPDFFAVTKEIIAAEGDSPLALDVMLTAVSVGYDRAAVDKIDTYNNDTLSYAKTALQKLDAGKPSKTTKYGVFDPFGTKEAAQSWMNYIIGWVMYYKLDQKKDALAYMYKSTQVSAEKKNDVTIYTNIGTYYFDEAGKLDAKYRELRKANNNEDNDETKALLGLARGTADRAIDAFGRAYKIVSADTKAKPEAKTAIYKTLGDLYRFRFNLAPDAKTPDLDKYVADLVAKPMPDPGTAVTPVVEEVKPATTTSTTSTTPTTTTPSTTKPTTPTNTKSSTTPIKQPTSSTTNNQTTEATTATKTTPAKKPVTKKKGTR